MKILIAGGTGFIGKHLLERLDTTHNEIISVVREEGKLNKSNRFQSLKIDFSSPKEIESCMDGIDVVIFLIGQMGQYGLLEEAFYKANCEMPKRFLEAAEKKQVKQFIYCSTPGVLGFGKRLAKETESYAPRNIYEETKVDAEKYIIEAAQNSKINYTIIRPDFVYGPGDVRRVKMYRGIQERKFVLTTSGKSYLHPTYIEDVISGILCCIANPDAFNEIFNIAAKQDITVKEYLQIIAKATNSKLIHINIGYPLSVAAAAVIDNIYKVLFHKEGFVSKNKIDFLALDHSSSIEKAGNKINFEPQISCQEGMNRTIQWCKENNLL